MQDMKWILLLLLPSLAFADYDRSEWRHWIDADLDCQNTRHEVLIRDSLAPLQLSEDGCRVISGVWVGQYTEEVFTVRSETLSNSAACVCVDTQICGSALSARWPCSRLASFAATIPRWDSFRCLL